MSSLDNSQRNSILLSVFPRSRPPGRSGIFSGGGQKAPAFENPDRDPTTPGTGIRRRVLRRLLLLVRVSATRSSGLHPFTGRTAYALHPLTVWTSYALHPLTVNCFGDEPSVDGLKACSPPSVSFSLAFLFSSVVAWSIRIPIGTSPRGGHRLAGKITW